MSLPQDFIDELSRRITGQIRTDPASRILYSTDASIYQMEPRGVVIPRTQDDLQATVELAAKYRIPILPRGAGTSLAGQAIGDALILDCSRWLDSIVKVDPETSTATVEPGDALTVRVAPSTHAKCERCWHYRADVGADAAHPTICGRCVQNLAGPGEARRCA